MSVEKNNDGINRKDARTQPEFAERMIIALVVEAMLKAQNGDDDDDDDDDDDK